MEPYHIFMQIRSSCLSIYGTPEINMYGDLLKVVRPERCKLGEKPDEAGNWPRH